LFINDEFTNIIFHNEKELQKFVETNYPKDSKVTIKKVAKIKTDYKFHGFCDFCTGELISPITDVTLEDDTSKTISYTWGNCYNCCNSGAT